MEGEMGDGQDRTVHPQSLLTVLLSRRASRLAAWILISVSLFWAGGSGRAEPVEVPAVNAGLGPCTADFAVADGAGKPLYNAKVSVTFKYGFLGMRRMELEVGTNSDGKARVAGLPSKVRKHPLGFVISYGDRVKSIEHYPAVNCNARYEVVLDNN
jgi:hypothetical protein